MELFSFVLVCIIAVVITFVIGFLSICIPYLLKNRPPKQYKLRRNPIEEDFDLRSSVSVGANNSNESSAVDKSTAVSSFDSE